MLRSSDTDRQTRIDRDFDPEINENNSDQSEDSFVQTRRESFPKLSTKQRPHTAAPSTTAGSAAKNHLKSDESLTRRPKSAAAPKLSQEDLERLSRPIVHVERKPVKTGPTPTSKLPPPAPGNAHKRYSSVYPCANRLLAKRWDDAARKRHQEKLATMKTYIDNKPPQVQGHLKMRAKKLHDEDQKMGRIERENHILLARMVRQMSVVQGFSGLDADYKVKVTASMPTPSARKKKELLEQIEESNQILMQRVEARLPHYQNEVWDEERRTNLSYLQRISRFPEGYQHVLERERVPPPLKVPLRVRINRSEMLRQKWAIESKWNLDEFGNPKRAGSPAKSSSSEEESSEDEREGEEPQQREVYLTKGEKLRREYIKAFQEGGERNWRSKHPVYTQDALDINHLDMTSSSDDEARKKPHSTHKIAVRLNRAQKLRLEEQEARMREQEQIKVPIHLSNIEARIDVGQDAARLEKLKEVTERDREYQFAAINVDESDYEPMITQAQKDMDDMKAATWNQVFHGVCLRSGFKLPDGYPVSIGVLWTSDEEDCTIERWEILNRVLPKIKSRANQLGVEIFLRDLKWGVPKSLTDLQMHSDLTSMQLENYLTESVGIHIITFLSHKLGQLGILPRKISIELFEAISQNVAETDGPDLEEVLKRWYRLNENVVPAAYSLLNVSSNIPDFAMDINTKGFRAAKIEWQYTREVLLQCMNRSADALFNVKDWAEEDLDALNMLRKSKVEVESLRAIQGPTEDAILVLRDLDWKGEKTKDSIGGYMDWRGNEPDFEAANKLKELKTRLQDWIKDSNIITDEVEFLEGVGLRLQDQDVKRYILNITESITDLLESSLLKATERLHLDPVREEVLCHTRLFNESIQSFNGKIRLANKVVSFFKTRYRFGIPPLVIQGTMGAGAASLLCKGVQKYLNEAIPINISGSAFTSTPLTIVRFIGASPESSNTLTLIKSICRQIKRANSNIIHQLNGPDNYSRLCQSFVECLRTATWDRPILLILLGVDKLTSDDIGSTLSWLPIENNVPFAHIGLSFSCESQIYENIKMRTERAHMLLSQAKLEVFDELQYSLDSTDIPNCQVELNRWMRVDCISLTQPQRRNLLLAATAVSSSGFTTNPWILRQLYLHARRLKSWEPFNPPVITDPKEAEEKVVDRFFDVAEKLHGKNYGGSFIAITHTHLLSLDPEILADSIASQIECSSISPLTPLIPIPRIPSIAIIHLLNTMVKEFELVIRGRGYERGPNLLKWNHDVARDVAKARYVSDSKTIQSTMEDIAAYFNNDWTDPDRKGKDSQAALHVYIKSIGSNGENWKGNLKPYKLLPRHVNLWNLDDGVAYNLRRLRVLPRALVSAQRYRELRKLFEDFMFVEALLDTSGVPGLIKELQFLIKEGRKQAPQMPSDCFIILKHLILFLRQRCPWISQFESTRGIKPPGLWLQEFNNFPQNTSATFADPIKLFLDDNADSVVSSRGGRIEYDAMWKPDDEIYDNIPFYHTNVQCCSVSIDGKFIVSGASDGSVKVWNTSTGEEIFCFSHIITNDSTTLTFGTEGSFKLKPSRMGITFVCFSGERQPLHVISCAHDLQQEPSIRLWNLKALNGPPKLMVGGHSVGAAIVRCEYLPPENRRLMSVGTDYNVVLWEVARCKIIRLFTVTQQEFDFNINSTTGFMPKGYYGSLHLNRRRLNPSGYSPVAAAVSQSGLFAYGSTVLTVTDSHWKEVLVRDINTAIDKERTLKWHRITAIAFSGDSSVVYVASGVAPDDVQMLAVERAQLVEKLSQTEEAAETAANAPKLTVKSLFGRRSSSIIAAATSATCLNSTSVKTELDIKRAKQSVIRVWNVETGHLKLVFFVEDYITSLSVTYNGLFLLAAGVKGGITGYCTTKGTQEFIREGHSTGLVQLINLPPIAKKRKDDEDTLFYTYSGQFNMSVSRSLGSISGNVTSPIQFISLGLDNKFLLWTIDHESPLPGMIPITQCTFNQNADMFITLGGALITPTSKPPALVRVWELAGGTCRAKFELTVEVNYAAFIPPGDDRIIVGCRTGLVRVYRWKSNEMLLEFWADAENALSASTLGYHMEWPFSVTGLSVLSYALHPNGRTLAVAVGGHEREAGCIPAITLANPKDEYIPELVLRNKGQLVPRKRFIGKEEQEKSADRALREVIKVTFWDTQGNCLVVTNSFQFPLFFDSSDHSCVFGPYQTRTYMTRKNTFFLSWSHDGKSLLASDDIEVLKECQVEIKGNHVYNSISNNWFAKKTHAPPTVNEGVQSVNLIKETDENAFNLNVSAATALHSLQNKKFEHTCVAFGNGVIGLRSVDTERGGEELRWFLGHQVFGADGGDVVGCAYVPNVDSRSSSNILQKQTKVNGVVVSARRGGTVVVQDAQSKEICAVYHAGTPVCSMTIVPNVYKTNAVRIVLCKADGSIVILRYHCS
ncbi:hypothetical protein BDR26DRAFT_934153 [Obelidium mucronatum]|nr:hypothetical protein BDR26DRAFT_934153 [Obelidium mucronatum]